MQKKCASTFEGASRWHKTSIDNLEKPGQKKGKSNKKNNIATIVLADWLEFCLPTQN
jgi:hypothetical protein